MFHAQRHGIRQKFFKRVWRHALQPVSIHAIHKFLEALDLYLRARALQAGCRKLLADNQDDPHGNQSAANCHGHGIQEIGNANNLQRRIGQGYQQKSKSQVSRG